MIEQYLPLLTCIIMLTLLIKIFINVWCFYNEVACIIFLVLDKLQISIIQF